ncbi:MAG TPA: DUF2306 domain-containing protein [Bacteroidia bacterium]|nr:DUF2306 domain-containing protein [Bacteroidia bacterium]
MQQNLATKFKTVYAIVLVGIMLFFVYLMARITIPYFSFRYDVGFLLTKQAVIHISLWKQAFYIHIATGTFVLLTGIFQFIKPVLRKWPLMHRQLGKIYVILILVFTAPSGFVMALYANGGTWAKISFAITASLWWLFTFLAYKYARDKRFKLHLAYMYRSYALTLTAVSLRLYVLILPHFIHLHSTQMYVLVAWLSWIPNLLIAEVLIRNFRLKGSLIPGRS